MLVTLSNNIEYNMDSFQLFTEDGIHTVDTVSVGDTILFSRKPRLVLGMDSVYNDHDLLYLIGYIYGDGCYTTKDRLKVAFQPSQQYMIDLCSKYGFKVSGPSGGLMEGVLCGSRIPVDWSIGNAETKVIPDWFMNLGTDYKLSFVAGLIDSDGTVSDGAIDIGLVNKTLLLQLSQILSEVGIVCKLSYKPERYKRGTSYLCRPIWRLTIYGRQNILRSKVVPLRLDYKKELLLNSFPKYDRGVYKGLTSYTSKVSKSIPLITPGKRDGSSFGMFRRGDQDVSTEILEEFNNKYTSWCANTCIPYLLSEDYIFMKVIRV